MERVHYIMRGNGSYGLGDVVVKVFYIIFGNEVRFSKRSLCGVENLFPNILGNRFTALENR